jgi:hypothetical protein
MSGDVDGGGRGVGADEGALVVTSGTANAAAVGGAGSGLALGRRWTTEGLVASGADEITGDGVGVGGLDCDVAGVDALSGAPAGCVMRRDLVDGAFSS